MIGTDELQRILVEVALHKPPAKPDTAEMAVIRLKLKKECDEILSNGGIIDAPKEIPDLS